MDGVHIMLSDIDEEAAKKYFDTYVGYPLEEVYNELVMQDNRKVVK
jgi:hypothetical protein